MTMVTAADVSCERLKGKIRLTHDEGRKSAGSDGEVDREVRSADTTVEERVERGDRHEPDSARHDVFAERLELLDPADVARSGDAGAVESSDLGSLR